MTTQKINLKSDQEDKCTGQDFCCQTGCVFMQMPLINRFTEATMRFEVEKIAERGERLS